MAGTNGSLLLIRCKEHKTEVAFAPGGFFIKGSNAFIPTIIRLNEDQPINANWIPSNNGSAAFAPEAIDFIRSLSDGGKLFVRITGFEGRTAKGKFDLANVSEVRSKVRDACNW
jgi:hypothetical protein